MSGPFDFLQAIVNPTGLQAPPAGQQTAAPGGGPPSAPPTGGGPQQQQPQPMAYQSPPDLATMYMGLMQRQQMQAGIEGLAQSLVGMGNAMYPGRRVTPQIPHTGLDPNATMNSIMQLQQYQRQQQAISNFGPALKSMGFDDKQVASILPIAIADPTLMSKVVEQQLGLGGDPAQREYAQAVHQWQQANPGKSSSEMIADRPELAGIEEFKAGTAARTTSAVTEARNVTEAKTNASGSFDKILPTLQGANDNIAWLADPAHRDSVMKAINSPEMFTSGQTGNLVAATGMGGINDEVLQARTKLNWLKKQLYSDRFAGTKNIRSNTEANNLGAAATLIDSPTNDATTVGNELTRLKTDSDTAIANLHGAAGKVIPARLKGLADPMFLDKGSPYYNGATQEEPSASSSGDGAATALSADELSKAKAMIAQHGRDAVIQYLKSKGKDTSGL